VREEEKEVEEEEGGGTRGGGGVDAAARLAALCSIANSTTPFKNVKITKYENCQKKSTIGRSWIPRQRQIEEDTPK